MLGALPTRRTASVSPEMHSPPAPPPSAAPASSGKSKAAPIASNGDSGRFRRSIPWILVIIGLALLVNWNSSRVKVMSTGLGGSKTQGNLAKGGFARFASGGSVSTAAAQQGANQCISIHKADTPTAQCQAFCSDKFKKFHCVWCKCRACDFCPKGGDAITEAAKEAPPPAPPPLPASPPAVDSAAPILAATDGIVLENEDTNSSSSSSSEAALLAATTLAVPSNATDVGAIPSEIMPTTPTNDTAIATGPVATNTNATMPAALAAPSAVLPDAANGTVAPAVTVVDMAVSAESAPSEQVDAGAAPVSDAPGEEVKEVQEVQEVKEEEPPKDDDKEDDSYEGAEDKLDKVGEGAEKEPLGEAAMQQTM